MAMADGNFLAVVAPVAGIAEAADTARGEAEREGREAHSCAVEAEVELIVGLKKVGRIEGTVRGEETAAVEGGLVVDEVAGARINVGIERVEAAIGVGGLAGGDIGGAAGEQNGGEGEDFGSGEVVVGPEEEEPLAAGDGDGAVHGVVNAGVGGAGKVGELRAVPFEPGEGAIGGGAVDNDDLRCEVALLPDAGEGGGEARAGIFADDDDADERRGGSGGHVGGEPARSTPNAERSTLNGETLQAERGAGQDGWHEFAAALGHHRRV